MKIRTALIPSSPVTSSEDRKLVPVSLPAEPEWLHDYSQDHDARARVLEYLTIARPQVADGWRTKYTVNQYAKVGGADIAEAHLNALVAEGTVERRTLPNGNHQWRARE